MTESVQTLNRESPHPSPVSCIFQVITENNLCQCGHRRLLSAEEDLSLPWYKRSMTRRWCSFFFFFPSTLCIIWKADYHIIGVFFGLIIAVTNFEYYWLMRRMESKFLKCFHHEYPLVPIGKCPLHEVIQYATPQLFSSSYNTTFSTTMTNSTSSFSHSDNNCNHLYNRNSRTSINNCNNSSRNNSFINNQNSDQNPQNNNYSEIAIASLSRRLRFPSPFTAALFFGILIGALHYLVVFVIHQHYQLDYDVYVILSVYCSVISMGTIFFASFCPTKVDAFVCCISQIINSIRFINFILCNNTMNGCNKLLDLLNPLTIALVFVVIARMTTSKALLDGIFMILVDAMGLVYICTTIAVCGGFIRHLADYQKRQVLVAYICVVVVSNTIAFHSGKFLPNSLNHKIASHYSSFNTIEGTIFAVLASIGVIYLADEILGLSGSPLKMITFAVLGSLLGCIGEIFQCMVKMAAGVRDSSDLIPGYGGVMDSVDGLFFVAVIFSQY